MTAAHSHRRWALATGAALATLAAISGCGGDGSGPVGPPAAEVGMLAVHLTSPVPRAGAVLLTISGPAVPTELTTTQPGVIVHQRAVAGGTSVAMFGSIAAGELLRMRVPDVGAAASYRATVREVAGEDNALREDLAGYAATVATARR